MLFSERRKLAEKVDTYIKEKNINNDTFGVICILEMWGMLANPVENLVSKGDPQPVAETVKWDWRELKAWNYQIFEALIEITENKFIDIWKDRDNLDSTEVDKVVDQFRKMLYPY